jgi:hypothetical protein
MAILWSTRQTMSRCGAAFRGTPKYDYSSPKGRLIVDQIFRHFDSRVRGDLARIKQRFGIPASITTGWRNNWLQDPYWRPYRRYRRSKSRRIFNDDQEKELLTLISRRFLDKGFPFTDVDFRLMAIEKYYQLHRIDPESDRWFAEIRDFTSSNGFIYGFKKRNHISSRRAHYKRRPTPARKGLKHGRGRWIRFSNPFPDAT